ncbi:MAG: hypothetical protein K9L26_01860 [Candidatus Izimaplasma sp.]|nr:hypothetical protein [Candidatus Izimaplasma bacterium]
MKLFRQYTWVVKLVGAALLVGLAIYLKFGNGEDIVIPFIGAAIIISSVVRLVPFVQTQKSDLIKTLNIIEITVDFAIGLAFILVTLLTEEGLQAFFGYLLGVYLMLRGSVHFFGISTKDENSDLILYTYHIAALIVGSYVFFTGDFTPAILINIILVFSIVTSAYLSYDGYNGYKLYREHKTFHAEEVKQPTVEKRVPDQEEQPQDRIIS